MKCAYDDCCCVHLEDFWRIMGRSCYNLRSLKKKTLNMEKKWVLPLTISSLLCAFLLFPTFSINLVSSFRPLNSIFSMIPDYSSLNHSNPIFVEKKLSQEMVPATQSSVPRIAYLVSGSKGDLDKLWRTLHALYHPRNVYLVHLDLESSVVERLELQARIQREPTFTEIGNVHMITKANMITYRGITMVSNTLHAAAILLKQSKDWDWFINLSASDYPLMTQDDILYTFSKMNRNVNFIEHTSQLGWKVDHRAKPLIIDPGLYRANKTDVFWATEKRETPTAFKLYTGSAWMVLSRSFIEFCIWGWDNLPRIVLMYYTNFLSSPEGYFQTVICNTPKFIGTTVNHDLHYIAWDIPPKQHPHILSLNDTDLMIGSNAPFARKFMENDPVLDMIDKDLLGRKSGSFTPGGWCSGNPLCSKVGDPNYLKPGEGANRLTRLMVKLLLSPSAVTQNQCSPLE